MATTRKKTNTTTKRFVKVSEIKKIGRSYYALRRLLYDLIQDSNISPVAKSELNAFYKGLTKARENFSIPRATNWKADSF